LRTWESHYLEERGVYEKGEKKKKKEGKEEERGDVQPHFAV